MIWSQNEADWHAVTLQHAVPAGGCPVHEPLFTLQCIVLHWITRTNSVQTPKRTKTFSARFSSEVVDKLGAQSGRLGQSRARIAERLIDEGLRLEEFPGVVFRSGPTGRRAGLAGGPDVWEIVRDLRLAAKEDGNDPIAAVSHITGLDRTAVELAASYYAAYPEEIDERIAADREAADRLRRALGVAAAA